MVRLRPSAGECIPHSHPKAKPQVGGKTGGCAAHGFTLRAPSSRLEASESVSCLQRHNPARGRFVSEILTRSRVARVLTCRHPEAEAPTQAGGATPVSLLVRTRRRPVAKRNLPDGTVDGHVAILPARRRRIKPESRCLICSCAPPSSPAPPRASLPPQPYCPLANLSEWR